MTQGLVIGVDPGLSGAIAFLDTGSGDLTVFDMPTEMIPGIVRRKTGPKRGLARRIDLYGLARIIDERAAEVSGAAIEQVNSMPGQGIATTMKLGFNFGAAAATVAASFIPITFVRPHDWKKEFSLKSGEKTASRICAARLFPRYAGLFGFAKDDGRAEAALLALWLQRKTERGVA